MSSMSTVALGPLTQVSGVEALPIGAPSVWLGYTPARRQPDHPETVRLESAGQFIDR